MNKLKVACKIILAVLMGLLISFYVLQHNADFKKFAERQFGKITYKLFKYNLQSNVEHIKIFWPHLGFKNLSVNKINSGSWHWQAENFNLYYSWLELIINKKLLVSSHVDKLNAFSLIEDGNLAIASHLKEMFLNSRFFVPIKIKNFFINDCSIQCLDQASGLLAFIRSAIDLKESEDYFKSHLFLKDGSVSLNQFELFKKLSGSLHLEAPRKKVPLKLNADLSFQIPAAQDKDCFFSGKFYNKQGDFYLRSLDDELIVTPINISLTKNGFDFAAQGQMPVSYLENLFVGVSLLEMKGDCNFSVIANSGKETTLHGHMQIKDLLIDALKLKIDEFKFFFKRRNHVCKYNFSFVSANKMEMQGNLTWNEKLKTGQIKLDNPEDIWFSGNKISQNGLSVSLFFTKSNLHGTYKCKMLLDRNETEFSGKILANKKIIKIVGHCGNALINIEIQLKPKPIIKKIIFKNKKEIFVDVKTVQTAEGSQVEACLEFSAIRDFLPEDIKNKISGKGLIKIKGALKNDLFKGSIELEDGNLIILESYNIIKNLTAQINFNLKERSLQLYNVKAELEKGSIAVSNAVIELDNHNNFNFIHAPIIFNNCFIFWNNIFGSVSGKILISKKASIGKVSGKIIFNNANIKSNIFSSEFGTKTFNSNLFENWQASLILKSKSPIKIKTTMLDCLAKLDLKINSSLSNPDLSGQIKLIEGSILFPYKPLKILSGNIIFIPGSNLDPTIELTAKARIRNYLISMFVTGSAKNAQIKLDSVPDLTEDQIGCLLLAGSENASLNLIVPTFIMQNLKNIIFGSTQVQEKLDKYYQTIFKPFKHIRFVPMFVDETGRGGFRGGIEIDVSDRLHALIQKNFSMPEDTKFEVDYQITDDVSIRAIKDERGDLGGEVEMRWKF